MKFNGNNQRIGDYYIGLDSGTSSLGWAATDMYYNILKFKGNSMWGVRLFDEASDASARRSSRTARRLLTRKKQRLELLEILFNNELAKIDPSFFIRLKDSSLYKEDKTDKLCRYAIFNDEGYTDKDYLKDYPTVYHLRSELIHSTEYHDPRLVYLALHHIIKSRGHFLFEMEVGDDYKSVSDIIDELVLMLNDMFNEDFSFKNRDAYIEVLNNDSLNVSTKKKLLREQLNWLAGDESLINILVLSDALAGATVKLSDLFCDESLKDAEKKSICLKADIDADVDALTEALEDRLEIVYAMKSVFDAARLSQILKNNTYISDAKIALFEENKRDLAMLKEYVKANAMDKFKLIFSAKTEGKKNFAAYILGEKVCSQEDFCKFVEKELPELKNNEEYAELYKKINGRTFYTKLKGSDNSVIPNQLHLRELKKILENASTYLTFLNDEDTDGITIKEKIISIFTFRIPYYVGPLNKNAKNNWIERKDEKIYPWNFDKVVDKEISAEHFITNLIGRCTYTGDYVLPKDSLLYSEYMVLNEINPISVNGKPITTEVKQKIFKALFVDSKANVTKKAIKNYLLKEGLITVDDEIGGIDDVVKSKLKSYHDFVKILAKTHDAEMVEDIIQRVLIFGNDKKLLKGWIKKNCPQLNDNDISYICRLKYKDWGRLSKTFLADICIADENGEAISIIDMLRSTNSNLMQLLSNDYHFLKKANEYHEEKYPASGSVKEQINEMYVSPLIKRSILQTIKIVDEIVDIRKCAPKKIFIEVARGTKEDLTGKRTVSRKEKLLELYKSCKKDYGELYDSLVNVDENRLRHDALYLYYTQFGKCMYSGETIDIDEIDKKYDIDHIFPQSRIKDDSLDNRVLVLRKLNQEEKGNKYPLKPEWQSKMKPFWDMLKAKGMISEKKYSRLVRVTPLTTEELSSFVARQLVETQQSTKALAQLLNSLYPGTKIVYSKAGNVSDFRHQYEFVKCRDINDLHHAKDAYLNIVVGNVYDTKFTEKFFLNIDKENYSLNQVFNFNVEGAWDRNTSISTVKKYMAKNNILVTRRSYESKGKLFDVQLVDKNNAKLPRKTDGAVSDTTKYGGYTGRYAAYFIVVEHEKRKKIIRSIEPVYIYAKSLFIKNPVEYCEKILGLVNPKVICYKISINSLIEYNGSKLILTGGSGINSDGRIIYNHTCQLVLDREYVQYIKNVIRTLKKIKENNGDYNITSYDKVTEAENIKVFKALVSKLNIKQYSDLFATEKDNLNSKIEDFKEKNIFDQLEIISQLLKIFSCNAETANLKSLSVNNNRIRKSCNITGCDSIFLINQSVTGLFETKIDLLK